MTKKRRPIVAGNWKMNPDPDDAMSLLNAVKNNNSYAEAVVCPPAIYLVAASAVLQNSFVALGGQDCSEKENGALTGDISATMLAEVGCKYVILGHSERRQFHGETDELIKAKAAKAVEKGLIPIICIGETLEERQAGKTLEVIKTQLDSAIPDDVDGEDIVIAYEPVWAIGTGLVATTEQIAEVHKEIRQNLQNRLAKGEALRVIYGGSVKPDNAQDILSLEDVDGALVGGASLKGKDFLEIAAKAV